MLPLPRLGVLCGIAVVLCPFAGRWIPAFDSLGILWPYSALALAATALMYRSLGPVLRGAAAVSATLALARVLVFALPGVSPQTAELRLLQHNLLYSNDGRLLAQVLDGHDIATLQEIQSIWTPLRKLPAPWVGHDCPDAPGIGTAVATRLPVVARGCFQTGQAWIRVQSPLGEVTVLSLHLPWPWPVRDDLQHRQAAELAQAIESLPKPVVIGGDFNQMPWSASVQTLARAAGGQVTGGLRASYVTGAGLIRLPIDHVIAPSDWRAETRKGPKHLSDHNTITARFGPKS
ncbi:hypothetical protein JANAI62_29280 [Jannaschia pagri]|uniref:Endonuclease/exonuclease/phosphatase domain-containing protein n=1 Tax=Jannaschia pagri TaxID=2829797 RepID=A0ABQ4NPG4_9RHOB|nr:MULTISPECIES: endonuclease/exonuclease/phosphatase family protein [unclassified Jannaschia]GIT92470.1 hypothetical protein JANAI61_29280 [Jannaschia sp. AI_61]GIT96305.1 hypothetical protein JANAI62_29280 [Jannaschia sp. AI_62]